jgi:hypothetical protein
MSRTLLLLLTVALTADAASREAGEWVTGRAAA